MKPQTLLPGLLLSCALLPRAADAEPPPFSHPPLHRPVFSEKNPLPESGCHFVDSKNGDDSAPGTREQPWRTVQASLVKLEPGDTLVLRGGIYHENIYCAIVGTPDQPITLRGYPGEVAVLDGGFPEFQNDPSGAWVPGDAPGEFVSKRSYRNIRDVLGLFADSNVGLQTYWHKEYLLTDNEATSEGNAKPFYAGPGLYYDKATGKIHVRLAHTHQTREGFVNYAGETDPRRLPLVIAPFHSTPLFLDQAMHLRLCDLVIRGGGFNTLMMRFAVDVSLDHVTIYGGSYCLRAKNSGPVTMSDSALVGQIPPWGYWSDNALQTYDPVFYDPWTQPEEPRSARNVARLPTHALLVTEGAEESDIFAYPFNNRWKIFQCEFKDAHDGIYFNGRGMELHHCLLTRIQDDGFYLSSPTPMPVNEDVHIYSNFIAGAMTPFGAHLRGVSSGNILAYGNVVDMRYLTQMGRPTDKNPEGKFTSGAFFLAHGRGNPAGMENIGFFYNTLILSGIQFAGSAYARAHPDSQREVVNNLFVYVNALPNLDSLQNPLNGRVEMDGNLHWAPGHPPESPASWMNSIRDSVASRENVIRWKGHLWEQHAVYGNPEFRAWNAQNRTGNDYRLAPTSPARSLAVDFPKKAMLRDGVVGPAAGALQGDEQLKVGINRRVTAGDL